MDTDAYSQEALLLKVAKSSDPHFCHQSINAEILIAKLLITVATRYLNGELKPLDVCRLVDKIDSGFLGVPRGLPDKIAYYPEWLGSLYNSCDWYDETWTANNSTHLAENLKTQIDVINEWVATFHLSGES